MYNLPKNIFSQMFFDQQQLVSEIIFLHFLWQGKKVGAMKTIVSTVFTIVDTIFFLSTFWINFLLVQKKVIIFLLLFKKLWKLVIFFYQVFAWHHFLVQPVQIGITLLWTTFLSYNSVDTLVVNRKFSLNGFIKLDVDSKRWKIKFLDLVIFSGSEGDA